MLRQSYNNKIDAWVKFKKVKGKPVEIVDVKTRNPIKPFKNVRINK